MGEILPGTEVVFRGLRWQVVLSQSLGPQILYRLRALEGTDRGTEADFLCPFEEIQATRREFVPDKAAPLRNWINYHQAFLLEQALGRDGLIAVQPGRLEIQPYQMVPVLRAIRMSRIRMLLADGVGLGKTIQAGLILTELMARRIAHRILVVSPAGPLLDQWHTELLERFGLRLDVVDRARLEEIRKETELGSNPFDHIPLGLVSIDFLKQERVLDLLERSAYDVIIIDEAHHCMDLGAAQEREDSQRRKLAEVLARKSDAFLLLTATPHDGNDRSFASLCELLDPSLVDGRGALRSDRYKAHVVRRLKSHIKDLFKQRQVHPIPVTADPAAHQCFIDMSRGLMGLLAPELKRAFREHRYADVLSFISLLKRSVSTASACRSTLEVVGERFQGLLSAGTETQESRRQRLKTLRDYRRRLARFGVESREEQEEQERLEAEDLAQNLVNLEREVRRGARSITRWASFVEALDNLVELAEAAEANDPKLAAVIALLHQIRKEEPKANILIYTEYVTSQNALVDALGRDGFTHVLKLSGDDSEKDRRNITATFASQDNVILVSTDAAAEGLNLQARCHHLIHLELPFNPNRLEQRNGRIDRYGQKKDPMVYYMYLRWTFEERILLRLIAKYERQRSLLTHMPDTLGITTSSDVFDERLLKGLMDEDTRLFEPQDTFDFYAPDEDTGADEATRELLEEIEKSLSGYQTAARSNAWLGTSGLNADSSLMDEACSARELGQKASDVDLARFVCDAVSSDGGVVKGQVDGETFEVLLPPSWSSDLKDLPGYDRDHHSLLLTSRLEVTEGNGKRPVGFLGRAHPLVRHSIDRVRSLSFKGQHDGIQDSRVSVVGADVKEPELLCTFLGRVMSAAGRELERVLAVRIDRKEVKSFYSSAKEWMQVANPAKALRTSEVWEKHFAEWGLITLDKAREEAIKGFQGISGESVITLREQLQEEKDGHLRWLQQRTEEILGHELVAAPKQDLLFGGDSKSTTVPGGTSHLVSDGPMARLVSFASDATQPPAKRSEAEGVLRIFRKRSEEIEGRLDLREPEILPLGVLMLIPEDNHAV